LISPVFGRFLSADWSAVPAAVPYANLTNPQTLNLYAMVSDNPETYADLDGHMAFPGEWWTNSASCGQQADQSTTAKNQNAQQASTTSQNSDLLVEPRQSDIDKKPAPDGAGGKMKDVTYDVMRAQTRTARPPRVRPTRMTRITT
jgi:hypothetical protein